MGNAYDYMNPKLYVCENGRCREATSEEIEFFISMLIHELFGRRKK